MELSRQFMADGEKHRVFKRGSAVFVDHVKQQGGKYDVINLTKESKAKTVRDGVASVKKYHSKNGK
jgi:hypothetical protein